MFHLQGEESVETEYAVREKCRLGHQETKDDARIPAANRPGAPVPQEKAQHRASGTEG